MKNSAGKFSLEEYAQQLEEVDGSVGEFPSVYREYCDRLRRENAMDFFEKAVDNSPFLCYHIQADIASQTNTHAGVVQW